METERGNNSSEYEEMISWVMWKASVALLQNSEWALSEKESSR